MLRIAGWNYSRAISKTDHCVFGLHSHGRAHGRFAFFTPILFAKGQFIYTTLFKLQGLDREKLLMKFEGAKRTISFRFKNIVPSNSIFNYCLASLSFLNHNSTIENNIYFPSFTPIMLCSFLSPTNLPSIQGKLNIYEGVNDKVFQPFHIYICSRHTNTILA